MLEALPFPLVLLALAATLMIWHVRSWRAAQTEELDAPQRGYLRRQFRRRMQVGVLLTLLALAMYAGQVIPRQENPSAFVLVWLGVLALVLWMILLAAADLLDSRFRLARLRDERRVVQAQLEAELEQARAKLAACEPLERRNGKAKAP